MKLYRRDNETDLEWTQRQSMKALTNAIRNLKITVALMIVTVVLQLLGLWHRYHAH